MEVLKDPVGKRDGIRAVMRERLNAKGDRVMLRECDARYIIENADALVDMLRAANRRADELQRKLVDEETA